MLSCQHGSRENQTIRKDFPKLSQNVTQGINESWKENTERGRKKKKTNIQIKTDKTCKMLKSGSPELWEGSRSKHKETMSECQRGLWDGLICVLRRFGYCCGQSSLSMWLYLELGCRPDRLQRLKEGGRHILKEGSIMAMRAGPG